MQKKYDEILVLSKRGIKFCGRIGKNIVVSNGFGNVYLLNISNGGYLELTEDILKTSAADWKYSGSYLMGKDRLHLKSQFGQECSIEFDLEMTRNINARLSNSKR